MLHPMAMHDAGGAVLCVILRAQLAAMAAIAAARHVRAPASSLMYKRLD